MQVKCVDDGCLETRTFDQTSLPIFSILEDFEDVRVVGFGKDERSTACVIDMNRIEGAADWELDDAGHEEMGINGFWDDFSHGKGDRLTDYRAFERG